VIFHSYVSLPEGKTIINHSQNHHFYGLCKPSKMGGYGIVLTTLPKNVDLYVLPTGRRPPEKMA
jgi:hypothetical protein